MNNFTPNILYPWRPWMTCPSQPHSHYIYVHPQPQIRYNQQRLFDPLPQILRLTRPLSNIEVLDMICPPPPPLPPGMEIEPLGPPFEEGEDHIVGGEEVVVGNEDMEEEVEQVVEPEMAIDKNIDHEEEEEEEEEEEAEDEEEEEEEEEEDHSAEEEPTDQNTSIFICNRCNHTFSWINDFNLHKALKPLCRN